MGKVDDNVLNAVAAQAIWFDSPAARWESESAADRQRADVVPL